MIRVLAVSFEPLPIREWNSADKLSRQYVLEMDVLSNGAAKYEIVERRIYREFPKLDHDEQYIVDTYQEALRSDLSAFRDVHGNYPMMDYRAALRGCGAFTGIWRNQFDEVWLFGGPYFGFYESRMIGRTAYWCNSPPLKMNICNFIVMGFSRERSVKEMLHNFGHRAESILRKKYGSEFEAWIEKVGTVHKIPGGPEYSQDEREWLRSLPAEWWRAALYPNKKDSIIECCKKWKERIL